MSIKQTTTTTSTSNFPVHIHPKSFTFYEDDQNTQSQSLTIINPYEFRIKFKVLSTAPQKYAVIEPTGVVMQKSCVDIIIKHHTSAFLDHNITDKLRIQIYQASKNDEHFSSSPIGKIDLPLNSIVSREDFIQKQQREQMNDSLNATENITNSYSSFIHGNNLGAMMNLNSSPNNSNLTSNGSQKNRSSLDKNPRKPNPNLYPNNESVSYLVIFVGLICLAVMFLPLQSQQIADRTSSSSESIIPLYFHVSFEIKLFASFVLGMVTMVILKA